MRDGERLKEVGRDRKDETKEGREEEKGEKGRDETG